ncbi:hypothetical protein [Devosia salina]|uniref:Uncharacterized protein n=1 Tax=Devosia salina TaxID=2860336 RepID=A0ABX8W9D5_9HYPH|nr:hypothetical protein [Devosia salina]QYO75584.1 hypothetical protein K1X15_13185 [Devosia salina]
MIIEDACCPSCAASAAQDQTDLAIACTLSSGNFEERVASMRNLASRHLLSSRREMLTLHLTYAAAALPEVEDLVAKESDCCTFLDFNLHAGETVELTITAPQGAAAAADELFAHFAPELARSAT